MPAGQLRHRITIQHATKTRDTLNAEVKAWSTLATVWAKVDTPSGGETSSNERKQATLTHVITIRHRTDVYPTMRVSWGGRILEILSVVPDNVNKQVTLNCSEVISE